MKLRNRMITLVAAGLIAVTAAAPALADRQGRNTIIGAGVGGVAGALLSDGNPWATIGGAAAGGLIGNVATRDHRDRDRGRHYDRRRDDRRDHRWANNRDDRRYRPYR